MKSLIAKRFVVLLVLASAALAGCAGKPSRPNEAPVATATHNAFEAGGQDAGEIAGRVLDDEFRPLAGARVLVVGSSVATQTTDDGVFYFQKVPARAYTLSLTLAGFEPKNQSVVVSPGQRTNVEVVLARAVDTTPYVDDGFEFRGRINCSLRANASGTNTNPECGQYSGDYDVNRGKPVDLLAGVQYLLLEVKWVPSVPTVNDKLRLAIRPFQGPSWQQVEGQSPIRTVLGPQEFASILQYSEKDYARYGGQLQLVVFPGDLVNPGPASAGATFQQDFTIYATAFYRMDMPPGYTRLPRD